MKKNKLLLVSSLIMLLLANACSSNSEEKYTIKWLNYDGTVLKTDTVKAGTMPKYEGTPTRPGDAYNEYTFDGWLPEIKKVTGNQTYLASYEYHYYEGVQTYMKIDIPEDDKTFDLKCTISSSVIIDWGDGNSETVFDSMASHTYEYPGEYNVRVLGFTTSVSPDFLDKIFVEEVFYGSAIKEISNDSYSHNEKLRTVTFDKDSSLEKIGNYAFSNCSNLSTIIIPKSVKSIGDSAFCFCNKLEFVFENDSVLESIAGHAFSSCSSLTSINIPASVISIGGSAFESCENLNKITVEPNNENYDSRNDCNAIITKKEVNSVPANTLIVGCNGTTIPDGVISIADGAFRGSNIASIAIPSSVTSIGDYAFYGCSKLKDVFMDNSSVTNIGDNAFKNCHALTSITIPKGVTNINSYTFSDCTNLISVTFEKTPSLETIQYSAFENCSSLTAINIPASVISIDGSSFVSCKSLNEIIVEEDNTNYDSRNDCNAIITKKEVNSVPANTLIVGCNGTTIPDSVISIGGRAFEGSGIISIKIPDGVTSIEQWAFRGSRINKIEISSTVNSINHRAFENCGNFASIKIDDGNATYDSRNDCNAIITKKEVSSIPANTLIVGCSSTVIPNNVTSIGDYAFEGTDITSIKIPVSVTSIGDYAFSDTAVTSITIHKSIKTIGIYAFHRCINLKEIVFEANGDLEEISSNVFYSCKNLTSVNIPKNITKIEDNAFGACDKLEEVRLVQHENPPEITQHTFDISSPIIHFYIKKGTLEKYLGTLWSIFKDRFIEVEA